MHTQVLPRVESRPAGTSDERLMRALFADTREDFFLLDPDVRDALLGMQYRARRAAVAESAPDAQRRVLLLDGRPVGCLETVDTAGAVRVLDLVVAYDHRHRGIAASTLLDLMGAAGTVSIEIPAGDRHFAGVLQRLGFVASGGTAGRASYVVHR